jgi:Tol biopolymer transport system component
MLPGWKSTDHCCGSWTSDGEYYVFQAGHDIRTQIWARREQEDYSETNEGGPIPITTGALDFRRPTIAADGKRIFAVGWQLRGEVVRFNKESDSFETLPGFESLSAEWLAFSRGGQQVAYVSYPQGDLWESRVDGTGRQQLTFPPMQAVAPAWSPSGEQLAFEGRLPGDSWRIYFVLKNGGKPEPITASDREQLSPTWSQDGRLLAFTEEGKDRIQILDLASREVSELEGSEGLRRPLWSPNGQYLLAHLDNDLMLYDLAAGRQEVLLKNVISEGYSWTPGSQYITYYEPFWRATERWTYRVNINEKTPEKIAVVGGAKARPTWGVFGAWVGSAPDGAPLMLRDQSIHHIYALDWQPD